MFKTNKMFQAAYVVDDIDAAVGRWMRVAGIGPFFIMRDCAADVIYRGKPSTQSVDMALCQAGPIQIELLQSKSTGPDVYRDTVPKGADGYHHQCYFADDFDAEIARFKAMGIETACLGQFQTTRFAYFDTCHLIGCMTEILSRDSLIMDVFKMVADAAVDWDGSDPVRII